MKTAWEIHDNYFCDIFGEWDVWEKIDSEWIKGVLDENNEEYDEELITEVLDSVLDYQKELQDKEKESERNDVKYAIEDTITQTVNHLDYVDVGKILVKLANDYLNDYC